MAFLDRVTGSPVEWALAIDGGSNIVLPGGTLAGNVRITAAEATDSRGLRASLVAEEEFAYEVTEQSGTQSSRPTVAGIRSSCGARICR
jgi:hypothetical protein